MNLQSKSYLPKPAALLVFVLMLLVLAMQSQVFAQPFKPGQRVECDPVGIGNYLKGTVLPYLEKDEPVFQGEYYLTRILIDSWKGTYPEGVLCQTERVRPLKVAENTGQGEAPGAKENKPNAAQAPGPGAARKNAEVKIGPKFKPGDRVECDTMGIGKWFKGTVLPYAKNDQPGASKDKSGKYFYVHRVRMDNEAALRPEGGLCFTDRTRLLTGAAAKPPAVDRSVGKVSVDKDNTLSADRPILECPVKQPKVKNGARPNAELLKKLIRCEKGEKRAAKGLDGAVTVDVTALQIGAPRRWNPILDSGDGRLNTLVYPVRVTYTMKTFYRTRTYVTQDWVRIINFHVNAFGEWQSGSEVPVKSPKTKNIPRFP